MMHLVLNSLRKRYFNSFIRLQFNHKRIGNIKLYLRRPAHDIELQKQQAIVSNINNHSTATSEM